MHPRCPILLAGTFLNYKSVIFYVTLLSASGTAAGLEIEIDNFTYREIFGVMEIAENMDAVGLVGLLYVLRD